MLAGIDYISTKRPSAFVFENVKAITFKKHQPYFQSILKKLDGIKAANGMPAYQTQWRILDAKIHGGLAQSRPRIFIVGVLQAKQVSPFVWPPIMDARALGCFLDKAKPGRSAVPSPADFKRFPDGMVINLMDGMKKILAKGGHPLKETWVIDCQASPSRGAYVVKGRCPCLTKARTGAGGFYVTTRGRMMTTAEMLRLQGINPKRLLKPPDVTERQFAGMIGNAVAVPVLARVTIGLCKALGIVPKHAQVLTHENCPPCNCPIGVVPLSPIWADQHARRAQPHTSSTAQVARRPDTHTSTA